MSSRTSKRDSRKSMRAQARQNDGTYRYKSIIDYLEDFDEEMFEFIRVMAIDYLFTSKGKVGITFMNPRENSWREKVRTAIESDDMNALSTIADELSACIIEDIFKNPSDFRQKSDDIPNALGQHVEIVVGRTTSAEVHFANGAKASLDTNFIDGTRLDTLSVYNLVGGTLPTNAPRATYKYVTKQKEQIDKAKKSGSDMTVRMMSSNFEQDRAMREQIAAEVENLYYQQRSALRRSAKPSIDSYLDCVLSLVSFILSKTDQKTIQSVLVNRMIPLISFTPIDFYFFVEPHKNSPADNYIIPSHIIRDWSENRPPFDIRKTIADIFGLIDRSANHESHLNLIDESRRAISRYNQPRKLPQIIIENYERVCKNASKLFPDQLAEIYAKDPMRKLIEDEMRFYSFINFERFNSSDDLNKNSFRAIIGNIRQQFTTLYGANRGTDGGLRIISAKVLENMIDPRDKVHEIKTFVNSTMFIYIPLSQERLKYFEDDVVRMPMPGDDNLYNPSRLVIMRMLSNIDKMKVTIKGTNGNQTLELLHNLIEQYDSLEPEIQDALNNLTTKERAKKTA